MHQAVDRLGGAQGQSDAAHTRLPGLPAQQRAQQRRRGRGDAQRQHQRARFGAAPPVSHQRADQLDGGDGCGPGGSACCHGFQVFVHGAGLSRKIESDCWSQLEGERVSIFATTMGVDLHSPRSACESLRGDGRLQYRGRVSA